MTWRYVGALDADRPLLWRLVGIWRHRRLLKRMADRDLRLRYAGSTLGYAWAAIYPLLFIAIYAFIFTFVFRARLGPQAPTEQYALYVISGLLPWVAFSEVAARATQTMAEHRNLVKHAIFPLQILPLTGIYAAAFSQVTGLLAALVLASLFGGGLSASVVLLIPALMLQLLFLAGVAWLLGALGAVLRDVKELVQVALMVGMFLTPIFYVEHDLPTALRPLMELNPMTHLLRLYREALLGTVPGMSTEQVLLVSLPVFAVVAFVTLVAGFLVFERTRIFLADIL